MAESRPSRQAGEEDRPMRWSVMIPVHNCAALLAETLPEVVAQLGHRADAEIVVVDDNSSDDPRQVVELLGHGVVRYAPNPEHLGAIGTFNRCVELARGELVHLLHGDDLVRPGFYARMESALLADPAAQAALCRTVDFEGTGSRRLHTTRRYRRGTGRWRHALRSMIISNRVRTPSIVVRRSAYQAVGPYRTDLPHAADWDMWVRVAAQGPMVFVDAVLACYRRHEASDTAKRMRDGANIRERIAAIEIVLQHVPARQRPGLRRRALAMSWIYATRTAVRLARSRERPAAQAQLRAGLECLRRIPASAFQP